MGIGGVVVNFTARTADAIRDIGKFTRTTQDAEGELKDLDRALTSVQGEFDQTGAKARSVDGDMQRAETAFESLAREVDQTVDRVTQDMRRMGGAVKGGADDAHHEASRMRGDMGELGRESGAEFISNVAEGIGSGQANLADVVSGTMGGLTNLAATLTGPVGLAAAGAAATIGLVFGKIHGEAEKTKERLLELVDLLEEIEAEEKAVREEKLFQDWIDRMKVMPDELGKTVSVMQQAGVEQDDLKAAIAGSEGAQKKVNDQLLKTTERLMRNKFETGSLTEEESAYLAQVDDVLDLLKEQGIDLQGAEKLHENINWLQGEQKDGQKAVTKEVGKTTDAVRTLDDEWDKASRDRTMKVKIEEIYSRGGAWGASPTGNAAGVSQFAATPSPVVIQPAIVHVTEEQIYRAVSQLLLRGDARNGRTMVR